MEGFVESGVTGRKKADPTNEEYREFLERSCNGNDYLNEVGCFAFKELRVAMPFREEGEGASFSFINLLSQERRERKMRLIYDSTRKDFLNRLGVRHSQKYAERILDEALRDPELRGEIIKEYEQSLKDQVVDAEDMNAESSAKELVGLKEFIEDDYFLKDYILGGVQSGSIDVSLWLRILSAHRKNFVLKSEEFREKILPQFKERFLAEGQVFLEKMGVSELRVEEMMRTANIFLSDGINMQFKRSAGSYQYPSAIALNASFLDDKAEYLDRQDEDLTAIFGETLPTDAEKKARLDFGYETFVHEVLHYLSGRTGIMELYDSEIYMDPKNVRTGVGFSTPKRRVLRWLNEAITERLAILITRAKEDFAYYPKERELFQILVSLSGIEEEEWYKVYFENYIPGDAPIPRWKDLNRRLYQKFGNNILRLVDEAVRKIGIKKTIEKMKEFQGLGEGAASLGKFLQESVKI